MVEQIYSYRVGLIVLELITGLSLISNNKPDISLKNANDLTACTNLIFKTAYTIVIPKADNPNFVRLS